MKFALRNLPESNANASAAAFESLEQARLALRDTLGWPDVQLGPGYTAADTKGQVWCAYRTQADASGPHVPRVVRIDDVN
ncbi:MAG TPA: hypothetical protein VGC79_00505 [Polyangiaceae bacterium]